MSIFSQVESGTKWLRSRFSKSISYEKDYDCRFGEMVPILAKFVLPGDVWRIGGQALVRFQPMLAPTLTRNSLKVRYFFVPLRLIEKNAELIITGSKDGHLYTSTLPVFDNFVKNADKVAHSNAFVVSKYDFWDYMGIQCLDYENIKDDECLPAEYWAKAYYRCWYDYYRDENLNIQDDFDNAWNTWKKYGASIPLQFVKLRKDYFISSLPWQLKGAAPVLNVTGTGVLNGFNFGNAVEDTDTPGIAYDAKNKLARTGSSADLDYSATENKTPFVLNSSSTTLQDNKDLVDGFSRNLEAALNGQSVSINGLGFTADDLRTMMAQTRIFERLARTGSRYTEYLHANFGVSPADGTMQRAQYLGGWSLPIVTTEVLQTAEDGSTPVGTMRGHGITRGGNRITTFHAKEFGMIFGIAHIIPDTLYTTGIPKELTYKKRFDFFNPSLQHLSEQEVRKGELFISNSDNKNDETFGFQAYANELRSSNNQVVGDLRDSLSYWNQALHFNNRPNLNNGLVNSENHTASFNAPFVVSSTSARPCIVQFYNDLDVYRPMVRYSTPGLVDHL